MEENTFYDIHMHAFNLSHPYLRAYIQRFKIHQYLTLVAIISVLTHVPILRQFILSFINKLLKRIRNLLSVMENDIGSFFLITENCLREEENKLLKGDGLHIGGKIYKKVVLTPLMMDFGTKGIEEDPSIHYAKPSEKPIVEQVVDVFNAIKKYEKKRTLDEKEKLSKKYPFLRTDTDRIFEIYPFIGLNTKNYTYKEIEKLLDKYFGSYTGFRDDLFKNIGEFDGDIDNLTSNFVAGIKVYPPLGFDPWPNEKDKAGEELRKVKLLYQYCSDKGIPITTHGSGGGFNSVTGKELKNYTDLSKWGKALKEFPELKLNIAHFPMKEEIVKWIPDPRHLRLKECLALVLYNKNVYVDFSNRAVSDKYYESLRREIDKLSGEQRAKLRKRILFGSDYTINLTSVESYNKYLDVFSRNKALTADEKVDFCCSNPERFLFSQTE